MPESKRYSAGISAGKSGAAYQTSLYDIAGMGVEQEYEDALYKINAQQRDQIYSSVTDVLSLVQTIGQYKTSESEFDKKMDYLGKQKFIEEGGEATDWDASQQKIDYMPKRTTGDVSLWEFISDTGITKKRDWEGFLENIAVYTGDLEPEYEFEGETYKRSDLVAKADVDKLEDLGLNPYAAAIHAGGKSSSTTSDLSFNQAFAEAERTGGLGAKFMYKGKEYVVKH